MELVTATELLFILKLDNMNCSQIIQYLDRSNLSNKLHGFKGLMDKATVQSTDLEEKEEEEDPNFVSKHISYMSIVETFLKCLTSTQKEGRIVIKHGSSGDCITNDRSGASRKVVPKFCYLLLDPSTEFENVLNEAHAIVLAGGTIRPFKHVASELFASKKHLIEEAISAESHMNKKEGSSSFSHISPTLTLFSCEHVVPREHISMTRFPRGPSGIRLDFRHSSRYLDTTCDELGKAIIRIADIIPNGMVVFLPSYGYEAFLAKRWKTTGMLDLMARKKYIHREPKSAPDVESTLQSYAEKASSRGGALLFCVVGGKMSEGINFTDQMARGVVIVGLPYGDITDVVLKTKMNLLDEEAKTNKALISGSDYYQNLCMRNVNQSIGRAIRHAKDYAAIMLMDFRYQSDPRIWRDLPPWLRDASQNGHQMEDFNSRLTNIEKFFMKF